MLSATVSANFTFFRLVGWRNNKTKSKRLFLRAIVEFDGFMRVSQPRWMEMKAASEEMAETTTAPEEH